MKTNMQSYQYDKPINVMCESYNIIEKFKEQTNPDTGIVEKIVDAVFLEGVAITFGKPTRNRVSYTYQSGIAKHKTLINKPFLDTHNDTSIRTHPPFGHVESCEPGTNPKNNLPCLKYKVNLDPEEKVFIRKAKRGDIPGCSIQVLVDEVSEKQDEFGDYIEANIREYLELSAVLIPGDGDTSITFAECFRRRKEGCGKIEEGVIGPDGILSSKKILSREADGKEVEEEEKPLMHIPELSEQKNFEPKYDIDDLLDDSDKMLRLVGRRETKVAFKGCLCDKCGVQMLKDNYENRYQLRCWVCDKRVNRRKDNMTVKMIRKEMGMNGIPSNNAPVAPQQPMAPKPMGVEVQDHAHPEYDQLLVKIQDLESELQNLKMGGISQEALGDGLLNANGDEELPGDKMTKDNEKDSFLESIRKVLREELTGIPEREMDKSTNKGGPNGTSEVPNTVQPTNGVAPSGGGFDSDDKTNKADGDVTAGLAKNPASDYSRTAVQKKQLAKARALMSEARRLVREANGLDPSQPNAGATDKNPKAMDISAPSDSIGGSEASEDPAANAYSNLRPVMKEADGDFPFGKKDEPEEETDSDDKMFERVYKQIRMELAGNSKSTRQSRVGMSAIRGNSQAAQENFMTTRAQVDSTVKEYLKRAGHQSALGYMS